MKSCLSSLRLLAVVPAIFIASCASSGTKGDTTMNRPDYYFLDPSLQIESQDDMVRFEKEHRLYGAVSNEERRAREGHYYSFPWSTSDTDSDANLLFEYRQETTGSEVHALRVPIERVRRKNVTHVEIIGDPYKMNGKVTAWKATIERNGAAAASKQSYLWE